MRLAECTLFVNLIVTVFNYYVQIITRGINRGSRQHEALQMRMSGLLFLLVPLRMPSLLEPQFKKTNTSCNHGYPMIFISVTQI